MILHANAALSRRQRERLVRLVFAGATVSTRRARRRLLACGVSKLRSRHEQSRFAGRTQILKPHTARRAATPSTLLDPDEACSRSKLSVGSTQTELLAWSAPASVDSGWSGGLLFFFHLLVV